MKIFLPSNKNFPIPYFRNLFFIWLQIIQYSYLRGYQPKFNHKAERGVKEQFIRVAYAIHMHDLLHTFHVSSTICSEKWPAALAASVHESMKINLYKLCMIDLQKTNINVYLKYLHLFGSFDVQYKASAQNDTDDYKLQTDDIVVIFTLQLI